MSILFTGKEQVQLFQAIVVKHAMKLYLKTGLKVNRAYTPTNMRKVATKITGHQYTASKNGLALALDDLTKWLEAKQTSASTQPVETNDEAASQDTPKSE